MSGTDFGRPSWRDRLPALALTLALQACFLGLLLYSVHQFSLPRRPVRETYLRLPRLIEPGRTPRTIDARGKPPQEAPPGPPPFVPPVSQGTASAAPPPDISGIGRALNDCAPERYALLTPELRAHCPPPGVAQNEDSDLAHPSRAYAKYEAYWQEAWNEKHWMPAPCPDRESVIHCLIEQAAEEHKRAEAARHELAEYEALALQVPKRPLPDVRERPRNLAPAH